MLRTATPVPSPPEPAVTRYAQRPDLAARVGQPIGDCAWFVVDPACTDAFAMADDDHQRLRADLERAARGPFSTTTARCFVTTCSPGCTPERP